MRAAMATWPAPRHTRTRLSKSKPWAASPKWLRRRRAAMNSSTRTPSSDAVRAPGTESNQGSTLVFLNSDFSLKASSLFEGIVSVECVYSFVFKGCVYFSVVQLFNLLFDVRSVE